MTSESQVQVAPCKQILLPESIREIMLVETGIRNPASDSNPIYIYCRETDRAIQDPL